MIQQLHDIALLFLMLARLVDGDGLAERAKPGSACGTTQRMIVINEVMFDPPDGVPEYVEILNASGAALTLDQVTIEDSRGVPGFSRSSAVLPADSLAVVTADTDALASRFPRGNFVHVSPWPTLNNSGDLVSISVAGIVHDSVQYEASWGEPGISIERLGSVFPSALPTSWAVPQAVVGTPGFSNSVFRVDTLMPFINRVDVSSRGDTLRVHFSEQVCVPESATFEIDPGGIARQVRVAHEEPESTDVVVEPALSNGHYTIRLVGAADLAGNEFDSVGVAFRVTIFDDPQRSSVVINEISFAPVESELEYVEIHNRTDSTFDLSRFTLSDRRAIPVPLATEKRPLLPGTFFTLVRDSIAFRTWFGRRESIQLSGWPALNNSSDEVVIRYQGSTIDSVSYVASWGNPWASIERRNPSGPSNQSFNWAPSLAASGGTPSAPNSTIFLDTTAPEPVFAEWWSKGSMRVYFDEALDPASLAGSRARLADQTGLEFAGFGEDGLIVFTNLELAPVGLFVAGVADVWGNRLPQRWIDLHVQPDSGSLFINEILFAAGQHQAEFFELGSARERPVSLNQLRFVISSFGVQSDTSASLPRTGINSDQFAVLFGTESVPRAGDETSIDRFMEVFPGSYDETVFVPIDRSGLGLRNTAGCVELLRHDLAKIDRACYKTSWHSHAVVSTTGISLERNSVSASADEATTWSSSRDPFGATPGRENSVRAPDGVVRPGPGDVEVSEILYQPLGDPRDGLADQTEFVELVNAGLRSLDLNGVHITGEPDEGGRVDSFRVVFEPTGLNPGQLLVLYRVSSDVTAVDAARALLKAHPNAADENAILLPVRGTALRLADEGQLIRLHGASGMTLTEVHYRPTWHHPAVVERAGVSLERIDFSLNATRSDAWTTSVSPSGASPGTANATGARPRDEGRAEVGIVPPVFSPDRDGIEDFARIEWDVGSGPLLVRIRVYDVAGRLVRDLSPAELTSAAGAARWDGYTDSGRLLPVGIYLVHILWSDPGTRKRGQYVRSVVIAKR